MDFDEEVKQDMARDEIEEWRRDARRWRALMAAGVTFHESDGKPPVLAKVSRRIWYHATNDQEHNTLADAMDAYADEHEIEA